VHIERQLADAQGAYLIPIGATGGAAESIATSLLGSSLADGGPNAQRPSDAELASLMDKTATAEELVARAETLIRKRVA
jgi:hypothetical protein